MSREIRSKVWMDGNKIYFLTDFDENSINELIRLAEKGKNKKNLTLVIKSYGGYVTEFRAALDVVNKYNIRVHGIGYLMSAGLYLWLGAKKRSAEPSTSFMYHEMLYGVRQQPLEDHKVKVKISEKDQAWLDSIVVSTGGFTQDELNKIKKSRDNDYYFGYEEALNRGLINYEEDGSESSGDLKISKLNTGDDE